MGLNQKQAVATLYVISAILGLSAVVLTTGGEQRAMVLFAALCIAGAVAARLVFADEIRAELKTELGDWREHRNNDKTSEPVPPPEKPETPSNSVGKVSTKPKNRKRRKKKAARKR